MDGLLNYKIIDGKRKKLFKKLQNYKITNYIKVFTTFEKLIMDLVLNRIAKKDKYTIGKLYVKEYVIDEYSTGRKLTYLCDTLEPKWRDYAHGDNKIKGKSAIPEGRYPIVITYSPTFKKWLPLLLGVPNFSGIRIHQGNTVKDTKGCILVGENKQVGNVLNSRKYVDLVKAKIVEAKDKGEGVWIEIR